MTTCYFCILFSLREKCLYSFKNEDFIVIFFLDEGSGYTVIKKYILNNSSIVIFASSIAQSWVMENVHFLPFPASYF